MQVLKNSPSAGGLFLIGENSAVATNLRGWYSPGGTTVKTEVFARSLLESDVVAGGAGAAVF